MSRRSSPDHLPQNLFENLRAYHRGEFGHILRRVVFHYVGSDDLTCDRMYTRKGFAHRHASWLAMRNSWRKRRIEDIDVKRDINRSSKPKLVQRRQITHLDDLNPKSSRLLSLM